MRVVDAEAREVEASRLFDMKVFTPIAEEEAMVMEHLLADMCTTGGSDQMIIQVQANGFDVREW